jgi:hypothetical protein
MKKLLTAVVRYMSNRWTFHRRRMLTNLIPGALVVQ